MPKTVLDYEKEALRETFPEFRIQDPYGPKRGVTGKMRTNTGREYIVWLSLGDFPSDAPRAFVISPEGLRHYDGRLLSNLGKSWNMHLLSPDAFGHPQICHYNDKFWHPDVSLDKILFKVRIWLHAYEEHLRSGKPIDAYLPHMRE